MLFQRITSFFSFFLTLGIFALAKPVPRLQAGGDAISVVTSLKSRTDAILPQIKRSSASGNAIDDSLGPLLEQLLAALIDASGLLGSLPSVPSASPLPIVGSVVVTPASDSSKALVSGTVATLVEEIVDVLGGLVGGNPGLIGIDVALAEVLTSFDLVIEGLVSLVASRLGGLVPSLGLLGFKSTLSSLSLPVPPLA